MIVINRIEEIEEQRSGRNKNTTINNTYINSGKYRKKFDSISSDESLNRLLFQLAKKMLEHRTGTLYEDMYWIDLETMNIVAEETDADVEEEIVYSVKTKRIIKKYNNLLTIHSHPNSFPPSISDINSNYLNNYSVGIIVCHNGKIYMYSADEEISQDYYNLTVAEYLKQGYDECNAQVKALDEIKKKFNIRFKEVTDNDV
ncbi:MAG: hypothetical protein IKA09_04460 [Lachnospiraceae bacterium]|nr:hypothetical protein [Lachnospiraceae bacterium]